MNDWFEAEQHVERAQMLSESQRFAEALEEIDAALATNPHNPSWQAHRGYLLEELDRFEEAAGAYETSLSFEPEDADVTVALAHVLTRLHRLPQALDLLEELAKRHPQFEPAYCHRIAVYAELGRHDQAEEMFYLAQTLDDSCPQCFFHMGASLAARGEFDRAVFCWKRVLELDSDAIGVRQRIAQAFRAQNKLDQARDYYLREWREDPGNTDLLYEMAEMAMDAGDAAGAGAKLMQIVELEPDREDAFFALAKSWLARQDGQKALQALEKAKALAEDTSELRGFEQCMGEALLLLGRPTEARELLEKAAEKETDPLRAQLLLGACLLALEKPEAAADVFRRVLAKDESNFVAHQQLAVCLMRLGKVDSGVKHALAALTAKPDFTPAMSVTAYGFLRQGRWQEARGMLRRSLGKDPSPRDLKQLDAQVRKYRIRSCLRGLANLFKISYWRRSN